jgi:c-di-GMP-binding flagellar brake protein YcgR
LPEKNDTKNVLKRELSIDALKKEMPIGQSCTVRLTRENTPTLFSSIQDINDVGVLISLPTDERGIPVLIRKGEMIEVSLIAGLGRIGFLTQVDGPIREPLPMLKLQPPTNIFKVELRKYYRVPVHIPFKGFLAKEIMDPSGQLRWVKDLSLPPEEAKITGTVLDISGGGIYAVTKKELEKGDVFLLELSIPEELNLKDIASKIVRKTLANPDRKLWGYGVEFLNIEEKEREKVVKYVFKRQRELRGLLT